MYKIIGADQKEYGPITAEQMRQWIAEGRANAQSLVWSETTNNWKPLSTYPEFAASFPAAPVPGAPAPLGAGYTPEMARATALKEVAGPATALMVVSAISFLYSLANLLLPLMGVEFTPPDMGSSPETEQLIKWMRGPGAVIGAIIPMLVSGFVFYGALKMKQLQNHGLCIAASIVAMLPCGCCCVLGVPAGIWALVVLNKPEIKSQFQ